VHGEVIIAPENLAENVSSSRPDREAKRQTDSPRLTLKLAVADPNFRSWWREILAKLTALANSNAVDSLQA